MTYHHASYDRNDEQEQHNHLFILPQFVGSVCTGYSCAKEWTERMAHFQCGCPMCLDELGLCLCYDPEDYREDKDCEEQWRKRIVSVKTAICAVHLIVPGYTACKIIESAEELVDGYFEENPEGERSAGGP